MSTPTSDARVKHRHPPAIASDLLLASSFCRFAPFTTAPGVLQTAMETLYYTSASGFGQNDITPDLCNQMQRNALISA